MKEFKINTIKNKRVLGRVVENSGKDKDALALFWGASALEVNVKTREVWVLLYCDYSCYETWVTVEVNGAAISRFMAPKEPAWICLARNLNEEKENLISIIKDTQAMAGERVHGLFIKAIGLAGRNEAESAFNPLEPRSLKIEFIGDSITSGEGLAGNSDEMDWITQWFCAGKTYAMQVAKQMNADWSMVSQCGWGLCWGWDGNLQSVMPPHYTKICSLLDGPQNQANGTSGNYDFGEGSDIVVLNLGTNDNSGLKTQGFTHKGEEIYRGAKDFLALIRKNNPKAKIVWTWNMIHLDVVPALIQNAVEDFKAENKDNNVYTLELPCMEDVEVHKEDKGSRGHPGPKTHRLAAEKIVDFLRQLNSL